MPTGGCEEPAFWELFALDRARPGREPDLIEAIALCNRALAVRPPDTNGLVLGGHSPRPATSSSSGSPVSAAATPSGTTPARTPDDLGAPLRVRRSPQRGPTASGGIAPPDASADRSLASPPATSTEPSRSRTAVALARPTAIGAEARQCPEAAS
jgi:hypothetical protein